VSRLIAQIVIPSSATPCNLVRGFRRFGEHAAYIFGVEVIREEPVGQ
jgi:hypothetical protein